MILIATDGLTKELCIGAYLFARTVMRMARRSGMLHCAFYLKQCASSLQRAYCGEFNHDSLPVPIFLTRSGYPRIIPSFHRKLIYKRDDYSDVLVQIYLSFGTLAKVVCLAKKVSKDTFSSIITPVLDLDSVLSLMSDIKVVLPDISQRYMPWVSRIPLHQGLKWELRDSFLQPITADSQAAYSCQDIPTTPPPLKGWKKKISKLSQRGRHLANSSLL